MVNKGNIALLQMALHRLHDLWPCASFDVMTIGPHLLKLYCPQTHPISADGRHNWSGDREKLGRQHRWLPHIAWRSAFELRDAVRRFKNQEAAAKTKAGPKSRSEINPDVSALPPLSPDVQQGLRAADLVVATGGGYLCDSDKSRAIDVLLRLQQAIDLGKPTAMVGQGIGPVDDPQLRQVAQTVLPRVNFIGYREERVAPPLLASLGVPSGRAVMTGDDAVEMAFEARRPKLGSAIGVSLRVAHYTGVKKQHVEEVRAGLQRAAHQLKAPLVPVPISFAGHESDLSQINRVLAGYRAKTTRWSRFDSPRQLVRVAGRCRLVVAGAFHAAVFALGQGIPVVGLVQSVEYATKFQGLVDQFAPGCVLLPLDTPHIDQRLEEAIKQAWEAAPAQRPVLLDRAVTQIALNRTGYQRLVSLIRSHHAVSM